MKLIEQTNWNRRDFTGHLKCEHCGHTQTVAGYDDQNYYANVIPTMTCGGCSKTSGATVEPSHQPRYAAHQVT